MVPTGSEKEELLARARDGDVEAFALVFESYRSVVHSIAYRIVGENHCDDVVMETYLKAWRALPKFGGRASMRTWLCKIAHNCALDFYRTQVRHNARFVHTEGSDQVPVLERLPDSTFPTPDREADLHDLGAVLDKALAQLSEEHRRVLLLRDVDGLSYREVAAAAGVSIGTVMSRLFYARRRMRRILEDEQKWQA